MGTMMSVNEIENILLRDWDPIDIADEPAARDEYHRYAVALYSVLSQRISHDALSEMLLSFEQDEMGFSGDVIRARQVAEKLINAAYKS